MGTRSDVVRQSVQEATMAILREAGVPGLSIEQVSARSGVAKTTIYRHWPSKVDLMVEALGAAIPPLATPNTGDARADLVAVLTAIRDLVRRSGLVEILPSLLDASRRDPDLAQVRERLEAEHGTPVATILELAALRGEIDQVADPALASDLFTGPVMLRLLFDEPLEDHQIEMLVAAGLRGLGARGGSLRPAVATRGDG